MYRASKARGEPQAEQQKWLDRIVRHCDYIVDSPDLTGKESLVYAGHGYTPIARFVKLTFQNDDIYLNYKDKANKYLYYIESVIIPQWRDRPGYSNWWETPFNWYLSYGCLLVHLHQITRSPYYQAPNYTSPDTSLENYYFNTVTDMANNHFNDFNI